MYIDMCSYQNDKKVVSEKSRLNQHMTSHLQKDVSLKETLNQWSYSRPLHQTKLFRIWKDGWWAVLKAKGVEFLRKLFEAMFQCIWNVRASGQVI